MRDAAGVLLEDPSVVIETQWRRLSIAAECGRVVIEATN